MAVTAPPEAWKRLGHLLEGRRRQLGYTWRSTFEAAGEVNRRLAADIETAAPLRINRFMPGTWSLIAKGYQVTEESMTAVLKGTADALTPASPASPAVPLTAGPGASPMTDPERNAADVPYADRIWLRLLELRDRGIPDPSGTQLFPRSHQDAEAWDGTAGRWELPRRVWLLADLQRRDGDRNGGTGQSHATAG